MINIPEKYYYLFSNPDVFVVIWKLCIYKIYWINKVNRDPRVYVLYLFMFVKQDTYKTHFRKQMQCLITTCTYLKHNAYFKT